uniref:IF rod domain-containing protein n=1 Tax=Paramormyrops kingsleyae TaxID=1676925 RepID=A0A3B3SWF7_9TELE
MAKPKPGERPRAIFIRVPRNQQMEKNIQETQAKRAKNTNAPRNFSSASAAGNPQQRGIVSRASSLYGDAGSKPVAASVPVLSNARPEIPGSPRPDDKETMKGLNNRLAEYLNQVKELEQSNGRLEEQIQDVLNQRGIASARDWDTLEPRLGDLRKQVRDLTMGKARLMLDLDNSQLATEDFKVKFDSENALRQIVELDVNNLRKIIDDTNLTNMQLESQVEGLNEDLVYLKKKHKEEVEQLCKKISESTISVEVDSAEVPDLSEIIAKVRKQYEKTAQRNLEDTNAWYKNKFDTVKAEEAHNTDALQEGRTELNELLKQKRMVEIELQTTGNANRSLENMLNDIEANIAQDLSGLNQVIIQLEEELKKVRTQAECQAQDYEVLLNTKTKLEAEISQYEQLLQEVDSEFESLEHALQPGQKDEQKVPGGEVKVDTPQPPPKEGADGPSV